MYHKIQTVYKRDSVTNHKTLLEDQFSLPEFKFLQNNNWIWTEKVDGTNIRVMLNENGDINFGGKTDNAQIPTELVTKLISRFHNEKVKPKMKEMFSEGCTLYGEGYGPKIQKGGGNYRADQDFVLFDVRVGNWWLERGQVKQIAKDLSIDVVPIVGQGTLLEMIAVARQGFPSVWGDFQAEGFVARPEVELFTRGGQRIITKIKCKDFLNVN